MSVGWDSLPLLPLRCILDHLSMESVLAATSTCRHWRQAMLLYEGRRDTLGLKAKNLDKNLFMARLFRKHTRKLQVYINCSEDLVTKFMTFVLPQFLETNKLQELIFVGPLYFEPSSLEPFANLNRIITETLLLKHSNFMHKLAIMGCEMGPVSDDTDRFVHKQVEHYSKPLSFSSVSSPADSILSLSNIDLIRFSALQHIVFEYELVSTEALETLSRLNNLKLLTLNVTFKRQMVLPSVDWVSVNSEFGRGLNVAINIINVPHRRFKMLMDSVFVRGMSLTSLKVMFCRTMYIPLIFHVGCLYNVSLLELVWVDSPHDGPEGARTIKTRADEVLMLEAYNQVNPFLLLCWQCINLRRLVIHGYWLWQYDVLGVVRLRNSIGLEVSSMYANQARFGSRSLNGECVLRVMQYDTPPNIDPNFIQEVNRYTIWQWQPFPWRCLPVALRVHCSPDNRTNYIVREVLQPLGVTWPAEAWCRPEDIKELRRIAFWAARAIYDELVLPHDIVKNSIDCPVEKTAILRKIFRRKVG